MIPRMLTRDIEILEKDYPEACRHIRAGQLRYEYFSLKCQENNKVINEWGKNRLKELEGVPAIQDHAFQRSLERYQAIKK